jgi:hypothetical protein
MPFICGPCEVPSCRNDAAHSDDPTQARVFTNAEKVRGLCYRPALAPPWPHMDPAAEPVMSVSLVDGIVAAGPAHAAWQAEFLQEWQASSSMGLHQAGGIAGDASRGMGCGG